MNFELYKKMLRGQCTPAETEQVMQWLREDPAAFEAAMLEEAKAMETGKMPEAVRQQVLEGFAGKGIPMPVSGMNEVGATGAAGVEAPVVKMGRTGRKWYGWAAAAVVALAVTGAWLYKEVGEPAEPVRSWASIENPGNGVKVVILPDSSRIWLNAYAQIRYTIDGSSGSMREVQLTGEAYFKVQGRAGQAFTVQAGNIRTLVLGTEFNIEAYPEERMVRVSLQEGKVQVNCLDDKGVTKDSQVLEPGQAATGRKGQEYLSVGKGATGEPQAWIHEGIVLNDAALGDALARIARKYDRKIVFDAGLATRFHHITAYYHKADIEQVLTQLGFTCDFKFKKDNNTYTIFFKHKTHSPAHQ